MWQKLNEKTSSTEYVDKVVKQIEADPKITFEAVTDLLWGKYIKVINQNQVELNAA